MTPLIFSGFSHLSSMVSEVTFRTPKFLGLDGTGTKVGVYDGTVVVSSVWLWPRHAAQIASNTQITAWPILWREIDAIHSTHWSDFDRQHYYANVAATIVNSSRPRAASQYNVIFRLSDSIAQEITITVSV